MFIKYLFFTESTSHSSLCFPRSCVYRRLQAFSLQTTSQGVFSTSSAIPGGGYSSLNGIRVLSLLWIMCGHSAQFPVINNLGKQPGALSQPSSQFRTYFHAALSQLQITTETGRKQLRAALCMCFPSADRFSWLWTPFYC